MVSAFERDGLDEVIISDSRSYDGQRDRPELYHLAWRSEAIHDYKLSVAIICIIPAKSKLNLARLGARRL